MDNNKKAYITGRFDEAYGALTCYKWAGRRKQEIKKLRMKKRIFEENFMCYYISKL